MSSIQLTAYMTVRLLNNFVCAYMLNVIQFMHYFDVNIRISQLSKGMFTSAKLCQKPADMHIYTVLPKRSIIIYGNYGAAISNFIIKTYLKYTCKHQLILLNTVSLSILDVLMGTWANSIVSDDMTHNAAPYNGTNRRKKNKDLDLKR